MIDTFWLGVAVLCVPIITVALGYLYGRLTGAGGDVNSLDGAVSKGLEARRDTEPEDSDHE